MSMMRGKSITETQRPAESPVDLETGKLSWRDGTMVGAFTLSCLLVSSLGGLLTFATMPSYTGEILSPWQLLLMGLGATVGITASIFGLTAAFVTIRGWIMHMIRVEKWDALKQKAFKEQGGKEVERTAAAWELDADVPLHMLALIVSLHFRVMRRQGSAPWAIRNMEGPVILPGDTSSRSLLTVSEHEAREAGQMLAQLGIVRDRGSKSAGEWVPDTLEDAVQLLAENWRKVGQ